jgi:hypothetical protein
MTIVNLAGAHQTLPEDCTERPTGNGRSSWSGHADVRSLIQERKRTHGDYKEMAEVSQRLTKVICEFEGADKLSNSQLTALFMIFHKIGRILAGNPNFADHWLDISGYARLVADELAGDDRADEVRD